MFFFVVVVLWSCDMNIFDRLQIMLFFYEVHSFNEMINWFFIQIDLLKHATGFVIIHGHTGCQSDRARPELRFSARELLFEFGTVRSMFEYLACFLSLPARSSNEYDKTAMECSSVHIWTCDVRGLHYSVWFIHSTRITQEIIPEIVIHAGLKENWNCRKFTQVISTPRPYTVQRNLLSVRFISMFDHFR